MVGDLRLELRADVITRPMSLFVPIALSHIIYVQSQDYDTRHATWYASASDFGWISQQDITSPFRSTIVIIIPEIAQLIRRTSILSSTHHDRLRAQSFGTRCVFAAYARRQFLFTLGQGHFSFPSFIHSCTNRSILQSWSSVVRSHVIVWTSWMIVFSLPNY